MKKIKAEHGIVIAIILIAIMFRFWDLGKNPAGFFADEASMGLNAYHLIKYGTDERGRSYPVFFEALGDFRDPVMIYSTIPSVMIFGLNEYAVRFTAAIYGILSVIMIYFLAREIGGREIGLWSSLFLAISPWHVHLSRVGFQLIAAIFWLIFALYFLHKSFKNRGWFILSILGFVLTFFSYSAIKLYLIFFPLIFTLSYPVEVVKLIKSKYVWIVSITALLIVFLLIRPYLEDETFYKRWAQVKPNNIKVSQVFSSYINHFSPKFLFEVGTSGFPGETIKRHSIVGMGVLYWFQLPLFIIGLAGILLRHSFTKKYLFYLLLLLVYPVGSMFTEVVPQTTRSIAGVIPLQIISALGAVSIFSILTSRRAKILGYGLFSLIIIVSIYFFAQKLNDYPRHSANYEGWQYGYREIIEYFKPRESQYDELRVTHRFNAGSELLDFYNVIYSCSRCTTLNNPIIIFPEKKQLFALRYDDLLEAFKLYPKLQFVTKQVLYLPDGQAEIWIGEFTAS